MNRIREKLKRVTDRRSYSKAAAELLTGEKDKNRQPNHRLINRRARNVFVYRINTVPMVYSQAFT